MTKPRSILIVDDEVLMVRTLADILRMHGWDVHGVHGGEEALEVLRDRSFDIVLMDVRMGGMSGVDALRVIRETHPGLPVMLMTAYSTTELLAEAQRQGAVRILSKPLAIKGLLDMLETITEPERRVLVVDDNHAFLATLAEIIQSHGYTVLRADSLGAALSQLAKATPAVVLLDMRLEAVDPERSVLAIRRASPGVILILYSGSDAPAQNGGRAAESAYAVLRKPFAPDDMLRLLDEVFSG